MQGCAAWRSPRMTLYGPDFSALYDQHWGSWGRRMWPFVGRTVRRAFPRLPAARVDWLDLCCGCGSLLEILATEGYPAVGLDQSASQLAHARRRAPSARLVHADIRRFALRRRFRVVTCLFDSLNYIHARRDVIRVFRRVARHLCDDGLFIFDVNTAVGLEQRWRGTSALVEPRRVAVFIGAHSAGGETGTFRVVGFARRGRQWRRFEEVHKQRGFARDDLDEMLAVCGFRFTRHDGETFARSGASSGRLIYCCRPL